MNIYSPSLPIGDFSDQLVDLLTYFNSTYIRGPVRRVQRPANGAALPTLTLRRLPPPFTPSTWSLHEVDDHTNNQCESWNRDFAALVGHNHPSAWHAVEALQQDAAASTTLLLQNSRGQLPAKRVKRSMAGPQQQLHMISSERRDGVRSIPDTLRAVLHTIHFC